MKRLLFAVLFFYAATSYAQKQMEYLDRGVVAIRDSAKTFISWRLLATDPENIAFNLYCTVDGKTNKLNSKPLTQETSFTDVNTNIATAYNYTVATVIKNREVEKSKPFVVKQHSKPYLNIILQNPKGYTPNDLSAGDMDGDGEYEIVVHQTGRGRDNSQAGITDPPIFQAYKLDGTLLWEINLGKNIREGAHYTQFIVFDLDGDGKAEVCMKTADGTIDSKGKVIGDSSKDYRNKDGRILDGPEFFTIFNGLTGEAMATTDYIPARGDIGGWGGIGGNGGNDRNGNRVDRFLAGVAYLDGMHPSILMCRGYYGRTVVAAWDWRGGKLTSRWVFDTKDGKDPYSGMGYHSLSVADVDADGKDEIIYGSMVIDDDGKGMFTTGLRHGDALHVSDLDPSRPGLEVFGVHEIEEGTKGPGAALYNAKNGEVYFTGSMDQDVGRGVAANIDSTNPGAEMWWSGSNGLYNMIGEKIGEGPRSTNFLIWWDGGLTRQLLDGNHIDKYKQGRIFTAEGCSSNNGSKSNPALSADLFGDWREELILRTNDNKELRIFSTKIPTQHRMPTLMHDAQYRVAIAWQNVGYNQPPHPSFYIGDDMVKPTKPNIVIRKK